jgi:serine/threonine-protein kinase RsbW
VTAEGARAQVQRQSFPGELDSLSPIREIVRSAAASAGLDAGKSYRLELAVDEIATNIIVHGYEEAKRTGSVVVAVVIDDKGVEVTLEDSAAAYDPTTEQLPSPEELASPLSQRDLGGLGVMLARAADVFRYERAGEMNRTTLGMRR